MNAKNAPLFIAMRFSVAVIRLDFLNELVDFVQIFDFIRWLIFRFVSASVRVEPNAVKAGVVCPFDVRR